MSIRDNDIEWEENKNNTSIEWDEIKDNLKIFKARKEDFIDLGNPFQSPKQTLERPPKQTLERPEMKIPSRSVPSRKVVYGCIAALLILSGFLFLRGAYLNSVIELSEAWEVSYTINIEYTDDFNPIGYQISMNTEENIKDSVKFSIDDSYEGEIIPGNEKTILHGGVRKDLPREIVFYKDSFFGKREIDSLKIFLPTFSLDMQNNTIYVTNQTAHTFYVLSEKNYMLLLQPGRELSIDAVPHQPISFSIIDLMIPHQPISFSIIDIKTGCIYDITVWVRIDGS